MHHEIVERLARAWPDGLEPAAAMSISNVARLLGLDADVAQALAGLLTRSTAYVEAWRQALDLSLDSMAGPPHTQMPEPTFRPGVHTWVSRARPIIPLEAMEVAAEEYRVSTSHEYRVDDGALDHLAQQRGISGDQARTFLDLARDGDYATFVDLAGCLGVRDPAHMWEAVLEHLHLLCWWPRPGPMLPLGITLRV